jgi:hypothetical protein
MTLFSLKRSCEQDQSQRLRSVIGGHRVHGLGSNAIIESATCECANDVNGRKQPSPSPAEASFFLQAHFEHRWTLCVRPIQQRQPRGRPPALLAIAGAPHRR